MLLSHNGMDVDLKLASRVRGIDAILGGHTHDAVPAPVIVANPGGRTIVTNAGSNGKFLGVLDLEVRERRVTGYRYRLLPVFSNLLPADKDMERAHRARARSAPGEARGAARRDGGAPLPPRQFQRDVRPVAARRPDDGQGSRHRVLAGIPLGHDAAARARRSRWSIFSTRRRSPIPTRRSPR